MQDTRGFSPTELLVVRDRFYTNPPMTFGELGRVHGLRKGQVAGIVYRWRTGYVKVGRNHLRSPRYKRTGGLFDDRIVDLMADGRMRTTTEIQAEIGIRKRQTICQTMRRLESKGLMVLVQKAHGDLPHIWQEFTDEQAWTDAA